MNEPTHFVLPEEVFTVFEFALGTVPKGVVRQKVRSLGEFRSVEDAFATARECAHGAARELSAEDESGDIRVLATEFGYDLKRAHLILARFWVHARPASNAA